MAKQKAESHNQGFWYNIPAILAESGNSTKALLYGVISSLTNKEGFCFASNIYLAKKIGKKNPGIISQYLADLEKEGWILITQGKSGNERKIYLNIGGQPLRKNGRVASEKTEGYPSEKTEHSKITRVREDSIPPNPQGGTDEKALTLQHEEEKNIGEVIHLFRDINPTYQQLFPRKAHREASRRMIQAFGMDKIRAATLFLTACISRGDRFCPRITTPLQLEAKWGDLQAHYLVVKNEAQAGVQKGGIYAI